MGEMCYGSTYYSEAFLGDVTAMKGTVLDADPGFFLLLPTFFFQHVELFV